MPSARREGAALRDCAYPKELAFPGVPPESQAGVSDSAHMGHELSPDALAVGTSRLLGAITRRLGGDAIGSRR